ncbi:MAG: ABC transporter ATP-binding protein [Burkholderiales bacterium]
MVPAVEVCALSKRYGSLSALDRVDLQIDQGEFFALLGPNGAGKTTLINVLSGLTRASQGSARVMGHDVVSNYRGSRLALGVVPQELTFDPFFTVRETLKFQSGYFGRWRNDDWIDALIHHLGLDDKANTNMRALSGGMKRRVLIAQALVHKPAVIVLDEPTAGVDVELRQTLWQFIRQLNRDGHTILLTTHYLDEAEILCERVAMLKQGSIVALDSTRNLLKTLSGRSLKLWLNGANLPRALEAMAVARGVKSVTLGLKDYSDIERILAELRANNIEVQEMQLLQPDLEDVFVEIMKRQ